jgi:putative PIN family toxin of toxin-antitoxin system
VIKTVIDTNVFVSSFFGGKPREVIDLWKAGQITLGLSSPIVEEYVAVLRRLGLDKRGELDDLLDVFAHGTHVIYTSNTPHLAIVEANPDDDKFIECAVALKCSVIISGDKHLKSVRNYMGIKIASPAEFLDDWMSKKSNS